MARHKLYIKRGKLGVKGLWIMITNELHALKANKQIIYNGLLSPILYLLFYSIGLQSTFGDIDFNGKRVNFLTYSLIGIFAMSLFKEMYQCVYRMVIDKRWGLLSLKMFNGISAPVYIIGISTFPIIGVIIQTVILYAISIPMGGGFPFERFLIILLFLVINVLFWASMLLCIALVVKDYKQRDFVMNTLLLPVLFAAPLFYSFENASGIFKVISSCNPLTYQVQAMRTIAFGEPDWTIIFIVLILTIISFIIASICLNNTDFKTDER